MCNPSRTAGWRRAVKSRAEGLQRQTLRPTTAHVLVDDWCDALSYSVPDWVDGYKKGLQEPQNIINNWVAAKKNLNPNKIDDLYCEMPTKAVTVPLA
jgi:hypothetical protein